MIVFDRYLFNAVDSWELLMVLIDYDLEYGEEL